MVHVSANQGPNRTLETYETPKLQQITIENILELWSTAWSFFKTTENWQGIHLLISPVHWHIAILHCHNFTKPRIWTIEITQLKGT